MVGQIVFPVLGEDVDLLEGFDGGGVIGRVVLRDVETVDLADGNGARVSRERSDFVAGGNVALTLDLEIKAGAAAGEKAADDVRRMEFYTELKTGNAGLSDDDFRGADGEAITEVNGIFEEALGGEIFAEAAHGEIVDAEFTFPESVVFDRIAVGGFQRTAVDGEVGLAVTIEVEAAERNATLDGLLVNAGGDSAAVPIDHARLSNGDGKDLHRASIACKQESAEWANLGIE